MSLSPLDLLDAHTAQRKAIFERVDDAARKHFSLLPGFDAGEQTDDFLKQLFPVVDGGQKLTGTVTTNYLAQQIAAMTGTPPVVARTAGVAYDLLRGVSFFTVYSRPLNVALNAIAAGATTAVAANLARDRLTRLVDDDLSLAHRRAALDAVQADDRVAGYRRVIRPEGQKVCGLCVAASDQKYGREELMPCHTRCRCGVMPIVRTRLGRLKDPGRAINGRDIDDLAAASAGGTSTGELARARFAVHEHGELGPVLRAAGDNFTGPSDVAA